MNWITEAIRKHEHNKKQQRRIKALMFLVLCFYAMAMVLHLEQGNWFVVVDGLMLIALGIMYAKAEEMIVHIDKHIMLLKENEHVLEGMGYGSRYPWTEK